MTPALYALGLYAGLLGLIAIWLMVNVGKKRSQEKIFMGDGGNIRVVRAMRGQMNFVENAPLALIMLIIAAGVGMPIWVIHGSGILLVVGRFVHALHFTQDDAPGWQRAMGMLFTMIVLVLLSVGLLGHSLLNLL